MLPSCSTLGRCLCSFSATHWSSLSDASAALSWTTGSPGVKLLRALLSGPPPPAGAPLCWLARSERLPVVAAAGAAAAGVRPARLGTSSCKAASRLLHRGWRGTWRLAVRFFLGNSCSWSGSQSSTFTASGSGAGSCCKSPLLLKGSGSSLGLPWSCSRCQQQGIAGGSHARGQRGQCKEAGAGPAAARHGEHEPHLLPCGMLSRELLVNACPGVTERPAGRGNMPFIATARRC
jgi:hypothetical protein